MGYNLEHLQPSKTVLVIDGIAFELSNITLHKQVFFTEKYGSVHGAFEELIKNPIEILQIIWELIEFKGQFNHSFQTFQDFLMETEEPLVEVSKKMTEAFYKVVPNSMPKNINDGRTKALNEINKVQNEGKEPCFATYFDTIAKRYGYTLNQFYDLTLRSLQILLKTIGNESYEELSTLASLHGKKLKPRMVEIDVTPEQEEENDAQAMQALKELQKKFKESNNGK